MAIVNTYLLFNGNCEEAFNFYKSVFGKEFEYFGRFKDMPDATDTAKLTAAEGEKVMHVSLPIGKETVLQGSDANGADVTVGNNFFVSVYTRNQAECDQIFNGLSQGGNIKMPLAKTFWAESFGMFTDKFGINWTVSYAIPK